MKAKHENKFVENWYAKFNHQLKGFIGKSVNNVDLQDMSQEVYLRMLRVKNPELIKSPKAYLFKVAIHVIDEWRNSNHNQYLHVENDDMNVIEQSNKHRSMPENTSNQYMDLNKALSSLPKIYSTTIIMKWHHGKTYSEIAKDLNISERQVKRYIVKGYAALRFKLAVKEDLKNES